MAQERRLVEAANCLWERCRRHRERQEPVQLAPKTWAGKVCSSQVYVEQIQAAQNHGVKVEAVSQLRMPTVVARGEQEKESA